MKHFSLLFTAAMLFFTACKTSPPQTLTLDGMTLTLPEGFTLESADNEMTHDGMKCLQNEYKKMDGGNTVRLRINRFDVAYLKDEDPDFLTEKCLAGYRFFFSENRGDKYPYSEDAPLSIGGRSGIFLTFEDQDHGEPFTKGEMVAVKTGNTIMVLHYEDFSNHYEKSKADWTAIKNSVKLN
jgi:hypothetical protein